MNEINAIGIMSGSSLDGLDLCNARFSTVDEAWKYSIEAFKTYKFSTELRMLLEKSRTLSGEELHRLDIRLGLWMGECVRKFIDDHGLEPELIGSHGHTVFHQVKHQLSLQIGNPHALVESTGLPVVADFRQQNVIAHGQGAPLVPIGDLLLFPDFDGFINLGGIANLSIKQSDQMIAGDIVPCNQVLNRLANRLELDFDENGNIASTGKPDTSWLNELRKENYYQLKLPKSISNEWVAETYLSFLPEGKTEDLLFTYCQFIAEQLAAVINQYAVKNLMITGGGAYNNFLVSLLSKQLHSCKITLPENALIDGKEALVFAFMAVLRMQNKTNCLASYTGAKKDLSTGVIYLP